MKFTITLTSGKQINADLHTVNSVKQLSTKIGKLEAGQFLNIGDEVAVAKDHVVSIESLQSSGDSGAGNKSGDSGTGNKSGDSGAGNKSGDSGAGQK